MSDNELVTALQLSTEMHDQAQRIASQNQERIQQLLRDARLPFTPSTPDGACLFGSTSLQLYGSEQFKTIIRTRVVEHITSNREKFEEMITTTGVNFHNFISELSRPFTYADEISIIAICDVYNCQATILEISTRLMQHPTFGDNPTRHLQFLFSGNNHYDAVWDNTTGPLDTPPAPPLPQHSRLDPNLTALIQKYKAIAIRLHQNPLIDITRDIPFTRRLFTTPSAAITASTLRRKLNQFEINLPTNLSPTNEAVKQKVVHVLRYIIQSYERANYSVSGPLVSTPTAQDYPLDIEDILSSVPNLVNITSQLPLHSSTQTLQNESLNDWETIDNFNENRCFNSSFQHDKYVPAAAASAWKQVYLQAASSLCTALDNNDQVYIGRAAKWYAAIPQLIFRVTTKKKQQQPSIILRRCNQMLNQSFQAILSDWENDYQKVLIKSRKRSQDSEDKRLKKAIALVKNNKPKCIGRAVKLITSLGTSSCDDPTVRNEILSKFPLSENSWDAYTADEIHKIHLENLDSLLIDADPEVGVGPRGLHADHLRCVIRAVDNSPSATLQVFESLGNHFLNNTSPWLSRLLNASILTAIRKNERGEVRPAAAKDRDAATWIQGAQRQVTSLARKFVEPNEFAIGVSGGVQTLITGIQLTLEQAKRERTPITVSKDDRVNAHNSFRRDMAIQAIRNAAQFDPSLKPLSYLTNCVLSLTSPIYYRSTIEPTGLAHLCNCSEGGEQGSALTNIIYPLCFSPSVKQCEQQFPGVIVKTYQDDTTLIGNACEIYGTNKAREFLNNEFVARGNLTHQDKKYAYGSTAEQRAQIPIDIIQDYVEFIDSEGNVCRSYGIEICGVPIGDSEYVQERLKNTGNSIATDIRNIANKVSSLDPHCASAITIQSLQERAAFTMSMHPPTVTENFAQIIDSAVQHAFTMSHGSDLLSPPTNTIDPTFTPNRAKLRTSNGGAGIRLLKDRELFINNLCLTVPQLIDHINSDGEHVQGLFKNLTPLLGENSFNSDNAETRWVRFFSSGSNISIEFQNRIIQAKSLHEQLMSESSTPTSSIFDEPIIKFAHTIKKVQKAIIDERQNLLMCQLTDRASRLPPQDARRQAFYANSKCPFANKLLGAPPHPTVNFSPRQFTTSVAMHFGIPLPILHNDINKRIRNNSNCRPLQVDPWGFNLTTVNGVTGGDTQRNHNGIARAVSECFKEAGIRHLGGITDTTCKSIFQRASTSDRVTNNQEINSIIVDMVIMNDSMNDASHLGGANHLVDFKTLAGGLAYQTNSLDFNHATSLRQAEVDKHYQRTAQRLDRRLHNTPPGTIGPFVQVLREYGTNGNRVLGPVIGFFGEASSDLRLLRDLAATQMAKRYLDRWICTPGQAAGFFKDRISREWGHVIARGWANLILCRHRDHVESTQRYNTSNEITDDFYFGDRPHRSHI
jgi:hypothetical protein